MQKLRGVLIVFIALFLCSAVLAQSNDSNSSTTPKIINPKDPTPKIDEKLDKEVSIPRPLHLVTKVGLGINPQEKIEVSKLIILIALWSLIFIVSISGLKAFPMLGPIGIGLSAFCITMIIGSTKAISLATDHWLLNESFFRFIDGWSFGNLVMNLFAIGILILIAIVIGEKIKKENEEDKKESGLDAIKAWADSIISKFGGSKIKVNPHPIPYRDDY